MAAGLLGGIIQLLGFLPGRSSTGHNVLEPGDLLNSCAVLAVILGPSLLLPLLRPDVFEAWRTPINFAARIASFSLPNRRGRRTLVRVCQAGPSRGGFWRELFLFTIGSRTLAMLLGGVTAPLPPLAHAVVRLLSLHGVVQVQPDLCTLPLWRHPTWQHRFAWVHRAASLVLLALPHHAEGQDYRLPDCRATMLFYQATLGVLAPALLLSRFRALLQASSVAPGSGSTCGDAKAAPARRSERGGLTGGIIRLAVWLRRGLGAGDAAADCLLAVLDGRAGSWPLRLAAYFLTLNLLYTAALLVELPPATTFGPPAQHVGSADGAGSSTAGQ